MPIDPSPRGFLESPSHGTLRFAQKRRDILDPIYERIFSRALDRLIDQVDAILKRNAEEKLKPWPVGENLCAPVEVLRNSRQSAENTTP